MIKFTTCEGLKKGYVIRTYPCGHRFFVRLADGSTRIVDLAQLIPGTGQLKS